MDSQSSFSNSPHQGQPVRVSGTPLNRAQAALLLLHGRGARAEDILTLTDVLDLPGFAYLAPQAAGNSWYPERFLAPLASNQPWLSSALDFVGDVLNRIGDAGIAPERTVLLGFSQGACLTLEFAARNARRYGGVVGFSGALIGPDETRRDYAGSLAGTPVFLGCSDVDIHVPKERVWQAAEELRNLGGEVRVQLYPNMDHTVNQAELDFARTMMQALLAGA